MFGLYERNPSKNEREKNDKKPQQFIIPQEEGSGNYFSTSEDKVIEMEPKNEEHSETLILNCFSKILGVQL